MLETIKEKEGIKQEESEVKEWMEEDDDEISNIVNLYYKL